MSQPDRLVAVDVETTGLVPVVDRIVEIGAVAFRRDGTVEAELAELVDPGIPMPLAASRVNGITDDMLRGRRSIAGVLPRFLDFLGEAMPVAHHAAFDAGFLAADVASLGLAVPAVPFIDTRGLAKLAFPGQPSYNLDWLRRRLHIRTGSAHRALADAHACRKLLAACLERVPDDVPLELVAARSGPPIDLAGHAPPAVPKIVVLRQAMDEGRDLQIVYQGSSGQRTCRRITPRAFAVRGGAPAVVAWCHLRSQERTFSVRSILSICPT